MTPIGPTPDPTQPRLAPERALPDQRFIPGRGPRPRQSPVAARGSPDLPGPGGWRELEPHRYAMDLFNHGYYWEAHEAWEELWRRVPRGGPEWLALRGMIQASAALLKLHMGHARAAETLRRSALQHFETALSHQRVRGSRCLGIDLVELASRFDAHLADPAGVPLPRLGF